MYTISLILYLEIYLNLPSLVPFTFLTNKKLKKSLKLMNPLLTKIITMLTNSLHGIFLANPGNFLRQRGGTLYCCYFSLIFFLLSV